MLFTTTTQWVALAIALVAGWLLGLASHPGGRKWKERYAAEREAHAATRKDYEGRILQTRTDHEARVADADARHRELERENAKLLKTGSATAAPIAPRERVVVRPDRSTQTGERRSWFDWNSRAGTNT